MVQQNYLRFAAVKTGLKLAGLGGLEHLEEDEDKKPFACDYNGCNKRYVKQSHLEVIILRRRSNANFKWRYKWNNETNGVGRANPNHTPTRSSNLLNLLGTKAGELSFATNMGESARIRREFAKKIPDQFSPNCAWTRAELAANLVGANSAGNLSSPKENSSWPVNGSLSANYISPAEI